MTVIRTPRSQVGRALAFVIGVAAVLSGAWLALLRVGIGARFFGVLVFCFGAISLAHYSLTPDGLWKIENGLPVPKNRQPVSSNN